MDYLQKYLADRATSVQVFNLQTERGRGNERSRNWNNRRFNRGGNRGGNRGDNRGGNRGGNRGAGRSKRAMKYELFCMKKQLEKEKQKRQLLEQKDQVGTKDNTNCPQDNTAEQSQDKSNGVKPMDTTEKTPIT